MKALLARVGTTSSGIEGYILESHPSLTYECLDVDLEKGGDTEQTLSMDSDDACVTFTTS